MAYLPTIAFEIIPAGVTLQVHKTDAILKTEFGFESEYTVMPLTEQITLGSYIPLHHASKHVALKTVKLTIVPIQAKTFDFIIKCSEWYRQRFCKTPYIRLTMQGVWNDFFSNRKQEEAPALSFAMATNPFEEGEVQHISLFNNAAYGLILKETKQKLDLLELFMDNIECHCASFILTISGAQYKKDCKTWCRNLYNGETGRNVNYGKRPDEVVK